MIAQEWGKDGIRGVCLAPGLIQTSEESEVAISMLRSSPDAVLNPLDNLIGQPEHVAGFALLAASPAGAYLNGEHILIDGGTHTQQQVNLPWTDPSSPDSLANHPDRLANRDD